eukprot:2253541-Rhodomonas_salina.6
MEATEGMVANRSMSSAAVKCTENITSISTRAVASDQPEADLSPRSDRRHRMGPLSTLTDKRWTAAIGDAVAERWPTSASESSGRSSARSMHACSIVEGLGEEVGRRGVVRDRRGADGRARALRRREQHPPPSAVRVAGAHPALVQVDEAEHHDALRERKAFLPAGLLGRPLVRGVDPYRAREPPVERVFLRDRPRKVLAELVRVGARAEYALHEPPVVLTVFAHHI